MKRFLAVSTLALLAPSFAVHGDPAPVSDTAALETTFDKAIDPQAIGGWIKTMAAYPNQVGSPHDKANAEFELSLFKSWGWKANIEKFDVLFPTPLSEVLETVGPNPFKATLTERPIPGDVTTTHTDGALPAYLAYGADGDVTGDLVYVNYGTEQDYKTLERLGVSVAGKIVIVRYGQVWRGVKFAEAQSHGAIGCIIYSDPGDDGYALDATYPDGSMRPPQGIQRGSAMNITYHPGDPLTPGIGATPGAKRVSLDQATNIQKIPGLPISYGDAQALLARFKGTVAPAAWRGALGVTYRVSGGPAVHLAVKSNWDLKPIYDVIAMLPGSRFPDQWVIRANHHDGWVYGASDPMSGQAALLAEARALGEMARKGWKPGRTIVYASWDGEEPMLLGSTEWAEEHAEELKRKAVIYINTDENMRGFLSALGSDDLRHLINGVANDVKDPETGASLADRLRARTRLRAFDHGSSGQNGSEGDRKTSENAEIPLRPLGSGSDYSSFIDYLGVPSVDLRFTGEASNEGTYHSSYDTFEHHSKFVDPGFVYDALLAKVTGRLVMRAADEDLPIVHPIGLADAMGRYLSDLKRQTDMARAQAVTQEGLLRDRVFQISADPTITNAVPRPLQAVPAFDFAPMDMAVKHLMASAKTYEAAFSAKGALLPQDKKRQLQAVMQDIDQTLTSDIGLPERPWYRNLVYAPGKNTGYSAKTLPGVREAIEDGRWDDARRYIPLTAKVIEAYAARLDQANRILN